MGQTLCEIPDALKYSRVQCERQGMLVMKHVGGDGGRLSRSNVPYLFMPRLYAMRDIRR